MEMQLEFYVFDGERDHLVTLEVTRFYAGCHAKVNALPEDCYPAEDPEVEFDVLSVLTEYEDGTDIEMTGDEAKDFAEKYREELERKAIAEIMDGLAEVYY